MCGVCQDLVVSAVQWACLSVCCVCVCDCTLCACVCVSLCAVSVHVCFCNYVQCVHVCQYVCVCVLGVFMCPGSWWHLLSRLLACLAPCPLTLQCRSLSPLPSHLPWGATSTQPNPFLSLPSGEAPAARGSRSLQVWPDARPWGPVCGSWEGEAGAGRVPAHLWPELAYLSPAPLPTFGDYRMQSVGDTTTKKHM